MARLTDASGHTLLWNLERCEETAVAGAFVIISDRLTKTDWAQDFSIKFYSQGLAVSDPHLMQINKALRRCGIDEVEIRETDVSDYARRWSDYETKVQYREEQRHRFARASQTKRLDMLGRALDDMSRLLPPHMTFAQHRKAYPRRRDETAMHEAERLRRLSALEASILKAKTAPEQASPGLGIEKAITLLRNTENPDLVGRIIDRLDADAHLQLVASEHVPQNLKDLIIDRILT